MFVHGTYESQTENVLAVEVLHDVEDMLVAESSQNSGTQILVLFEQIDLRLNIGWPAR